MELKGVILAAITLNKEKVAGGVPIFYVENEEDMEEMAASLANILNGSVHKLITGTVIIVKH